MGVLRYFIWLDMAVCAVFAVPGLSDLTFQVLSGLNQVIGFGPFAAPEGVGKFFVNFAGVLGVAFNWRLLNASARELHWINLPARAAVSALLIYHVSMGNAPTILLAFVATEVIGGLVEYRWLKQAT